MRILCILGILCSVVGLGLSMGLFDHMLDNQRYFDAFLWALMVIICVVNAAGCAANLINTKK